MRVLVVICCLAVGLWAATARAAVDVVFVLPEHYLDAGLFDRLRRADRDITLDRLRRHLEALGARDLTPTQTLTIEVLDIDLAGELRWWGAGEVRVLRSINWPRIKLRYTLMRDDEVVLSGEELVSDRAYLMRPSLRRSRDPLRYEKAMLDDWFRRRFNTAG